MISSKHINLYNFKDVDNQHESGQSRNAFAGDHPLHALGLWHGCGRAAA